jgi:hypothetical protein
VISGGNRPSPAAHPIRPHIRMRLNRSRSSPRLLPRMPPRIA